VTSGADTVVIYNPNHSGGRRASDITHELAHVVLGHEPGTIVLSEDGTMAMRSFNQKQEDEANWLAWSLLLPRDALVAALRSGASDEDIATSYGVTEILVRFRKKLTGVERQVKGSPSARAPKALPISSPKSFGGATKQAARKLVRSGI
jgi:Zn-dependent peptidase ImmA (M78 family)